MKLKSTWYEPRIKMFAKVKQRMINSHCAKHLNLKKNVQKNVVKKKTGFSLSSFEPASTRVKIHGKSQMTDTVV